MAKAFITGVTGQDGFYLADLLVRKGYEVHGLVRRVSQGAEVPPRVTIHEGDITDPLVTRLIESIAPDEIYNLAAMSHVGQSFKAPSYTMAVNSMGMINIIEAAKDLGAKFYQASTSELFGVTPPPQNEKSKFHPRSPYGVSKLAAYYTTVNYREAYDVKAYNGILFNHESPRRGKDFVTQKIAEGVAMIYLGQHDHIRLGNLDAERDWGHAADYVYGMWLMLQNEPGDYVLATGETHSIKDFLSKAFAIINVDDWDRYVVTDESFLRPAEVPRLCGDPSKMESIGWKRKYDFDSLVEEMVECAIHRFGGSLPSTSQRSSLKLVPTRRSAH